MPGRRRRGGRPGSGTLVLLPAPLPSSLLSRPAPGPETGRRGRDVRPPAAPPSTASVFVRADAGRSLKRRQSRTALVRPRLPPPLPSAADPSFGPRAPTAAARRAAMDSTTTAHASAGPVGVQPLSLFGRGPPSRRSLLRAAPWLADGARENIAGSAPARARATAGVGGSTRRPSPPPGAPRPRAQREPRRREGAPIRRRRRRRVAAGTRMKGPRGREQLARGGQRRFGPSIPPETPTHAVV